MDPHIKATALARIIDDINRKYLDELCGEPLPSDEADSSAASRQAAPSNTDCSQGRCFGGVAGSPCFSGRLKGIPSTGKDLEEITVLENGRKVAVVATIDKLTKEGDRDLPVVIAVGINYGQMGRTDYLSGSVDLWDATGMRTKLDKAVALANETECHCVHRNFPNPGEYHLVSTNFFPWITQQAWDCYGFNSIEETLLIGCHGYRDPYAHIKDICQRLGGALVGLVFHGANNAVPYMGAEFLRAHGAAKSTAEQPDIIFCDNLAGSPNQTIKNAVRLCGRGMRRGDVPESFDE